MLSIGWTEMMLIAAIALIVVGPKDLPAMLQQVGKFAGQLRRMGNDFRQEINKAVAVDEIKDLKKSVTNPLTSIKQDIQKDFNSIGTDGSVKPSGALKPADPKVEDVTSEIRKAAGMPASVDEAGKNARDAMTEAMRKAQSEALAPVKAEAAEAAAPAAAAAKPKTAKPKAAAKKPAARKPATKPAAVTSAESKPATKKPAAKKPAAKKPTAKTTRARRQTATTDADGAST